LAGNALGAETWRAVVPSPGEPFANAPPLALALRDERRDGLKENVRYRGIRQRYAHIAVNFVSKQITAAVEHSALS
jgi:hypothetical protein